MDDTLWMTHHGYIYGTFSSRAGCLKLGWPSMPGTCLRVDTNTVI